MTGKKYDEKLYLDIPFGEALERFVKTDLKEVAASIAKSKKVKPPGGKLKPPGTVSEAKNVVRLASVRKPGGGKRG